jgi:hypothetical protein
MRQRRTTPFISFDLGEPETARTMAQEIADKIGREIILTDKDGNEVFTAQPIRRTEPIVEPKTLD